MPRVSSVGQHSFKVTFVADICGWHLWLAFVAGTNRVTEATPTPTGPTSWEVAIRFGGEDERKSLEPPQPGTWHFQFDSSGGSHRGTQLFGFG
jgi:hypothetical protein